MSSDSSDDSPGILQNVLTFVFVGGILEVLGMLLYLSQTSEAALDRLMTGGMSLEDVVMFLLASPDRLLVASGLALLALILVWKGGNSGRHHHVEGGGDF
jgi:elongation factor P--beta-lysine ligase